MSTMGPPDDPGISGAVCFVFVGVAGFSGRPEMDHRRCLLLKHVCRLVGHQTQIGLSLTRTEEDVISVSHRTRREAAGEILSVRIVVYANGIKIRAIAAFENALRARMHRLAAAGGIG